MTRFIDMPQLYRGLWPQVIARLSKYAVRNVDGKWRITVLYAAGDGLRFLAVAGQGDDLIERINRAKLEAGGQAGGAFYVNEYRHVVVPVGGGEDNGRGATYYYVSKCYEDFVFDFEGTPLSTKPVAADGTPLKPGDRWHGPRPGIPYVLRASGRDIYYETPALTDTDPPTVRARMTRRVELSKVLRNPEALERAVHPVRLQRGAAGGRFYVNEHGSMFTPVTADDGNGLDYIYCGQVDRNVWFPEPPVQ